MSAALLIIREQMECIHETEDRLEKSRERNREHAKQTRLRKKNHLDAMKSRLMELQEEAMKLQQLLDENQTANILLCLGEQNSLAADFAEFEGDDFHGDLVDQLKHSVRVEAADKRKWNMTDSDENDCKMNRSSESAIDTIDGDAHLDEKLRRERNRMHAKLTRDRKKLFTQKISQMIVKLEKQNKQMYLKLKAQQSSKKSGNLEPCFSLDDSPRDTWTDYSSDSVHTL